MKIEQLTAAHPDHARRAAALRVLALDAVKAANSGHSGMPMGMADVATVLFERHLKFSAAHPDWADRDRFILSAGHGSMLLYGLLHLTGTPGMEIEDIRNFRQLGSKTAGHPEHGHAPGIETTTGPLGQGIANAVGFAMAEEHLKARFGSKIVDHKTWVIAGDGCLMEGVSQEAIALAGRQQLKNLIVLWDNNGITIDGKVSLADVTDQKARVAASGWDVFECDGHEPESIDAALTAAAASPRPAFVACTTHIAIGSSAQDTSKGHGALTDDQLIADARTAYGWEAAPFEIPGDVKSAWEETGKRGDAAFDAWCARLDALSGTKKAEFARVMAGMSPKKLSATVKAHKKALSESQPKVATRKASEMALAAIAPVMPEMMSGSADLTGSNLTKTGNIAAFTPEDRKGRHIHY
ncbi:MAG: thiamine pyrophosphate-dependent enzyme, partial [Pseudomonadota bacterium]